MHGPAETEENKFQRSAPSDGADHARTAGNEIDVAAHERHVCHRGGHENQLDVQIFFAKVAFLLGHHQGRMDWLNVATAICTLRASAPAAKQTKNISAPNTVKFGLRPVMRFV